MQPVSLTGPCARFFFALTMETRKRQRFGAALLQPSTLGIFEMTQADMMKLGIAGAILFAAYKYGNSMVKAGALAVAAGIVAKRVPYVKDVL